MFEHGEIHVCCEVLEDMSLCLKKIKYIWFFAKNRELAAVNVILNCFLQKLVMPGKLSGYGVSNVFLKV